MQITPTHASLHALGTHLTPPEPVRQAAETVAAEAITPAREVVDSARTSDERTPPVADRQGGQVDILA